MAVKRIGNIERVLISECVKDIPSFSKIKRLFDMGADPNAVNEIGECVLGIVLEGYCSLYGANLRSGFLCRCWWRYLRKTALTSADTV